MLRSANIRFVRVPAAGLLAAAFGLAVAAVGHAGGQEESGPVNPRGVIEYLEGEVLLEGAPAEIGQEVPLGAVIETAEQSLCEVVFAGRNIFRIEAGSLARIEIEEARGAIELEAQVTGTPELALGTADERLDVSGSADHEKRIPMIVANTGSAPLEAVKMAGTAPTDWEISFDPEQIDAVQPGETAQVTAIVKPSSDAVAGDYSLTVRSSAGSLSSSVDLRYSLGGSRTLGVVAIAVIVAALAALGVVFVKFGRR